MQKISFSRILFNILFQGILLVGILLRVLTIKDRGLWMDEVFSLGHYHGSLSWQQAFLNSMHDNTPPLYNILLHWSMVVFGPSIESSRGVSVVFGILILPFFYLLCREYTKGNKWAGLVGLLLVSLNPYLIHYSHEMRPYSALIFFAVVAYYFMLKFLREEKSFDFWLWLVCMLAALNCHFFGVIPVVHQVSWYLRSPRRKVWRQDLKVASPLLLLGLVLPAIASLRVMMNFYSPRFIANWIGSFGSWFARLQALSYEWFGSSWSWGVFLLAGLFVSWRIARKSDLYRDHFMLFDAFVIFALTVLIDTLYKPVLTARYCQILVVIFVLGLLGAVARLQNRFMQMFMWILLVCCLVPDAYRRAGWRYNMLSYDHYVELLERKNKELNERIYFVGTEILGVKAYAEILKRPLDLEVVSLNDLEKTMKKKWVTFDHIETTAFYCPELGRISKEFAEVQGYKAFYYAEVDPGFKCNP